MEAEDLKNRFPATHIPRFKELHPSVSLGPAVLQWARSRNEKSTFVVLSL